MANLNVATSANAFRRQCLPSFRLSSSATPFRCLCFYHHARHHKRNHDGRLPEIETDSLAKTLKDHREANRQLLQRNAGEAFSDEAPGTEQKYLRDDQSTVKRQKQVKPISMKMKVSYENGRRRSRSNGRKKRDQLRAAAEEKKEPFDSSRLKGLDWKVNRHKSETAQCPWLNDLEGSGSSGMSRLNEEIHAFKSYMSEIPQEETAVQKTRQQVAEVFSQNGLPNPLLFGSRETGMTLRHSDLELLIPGSEHEADEHLSRAFKALRNSTNFSRATNSPSPSRIPYVCALHPSTGVAVTIYSGNNLLSNSEYVLNYVSEFPTLPHLYTVLRMILETRSIFGEANDAVSSYGLTMMIVAALKLGQSASGRNNDVGRQLLSILKFYADADLSRYGIGVDPPEVFCKPGKTPIAQKSNDFCPTTRTRAQMSMAKRSASQPASLLCLQDPANRTVDLGKWCFQTSRIQRLFGELYDDLESSVLAWEGEDVQKGRAGVLSDDRRRYASAGLIRKSGNKQSVSLLRSALGANYDSLEKLRDKAVLGHGSE